MTNLICIVFIQAPDDYAEVPIPDYWTEESLTSLVDYLAQWDYGAESDMDDYTELSELESLPYDDVLEHNGYWISHNSGLGYIGLYREPNN